MYERFLTEAARIEHQRALELTATRGWLLPAKPSIARALAARIRSRQRRHNIEALTQTAATDAQAAALALDGVVATAACVDTAFLDRSVTATGTPLSTTEADTRGMATIGGRQPDKILDAARPTATVASSSR